MNQDNTEKLQKVLARAGLASRRQIEEWIREGRVQVNRRTAKIGDRVDGSKDKISVNGRQLNPKKLHAPPQKIICYHKPVGEICSRFDPEDRPTIFQKLPRPMHGRWISVGRLDFNTAGLLLLTTDGELANRLMHPSYTIEREYAVRVYRKVDDTVLSNLQEGVKLDDGMARFEQIIDAGGEGANHWYHVILKEGRKNEVRRLWESQEIVVSRLIRIRFGPVSLPRNLRLGHFVELDKVSHRELLKQVGLETLPSESKPKPRRNFRTAFQKRERKFRR